SVRMTRGVSKRGQTLRLSSCALARSCPMVPPESPLADPADDRGEGGGRRGAIEEPPTVGAKLGVKCHQALAKRAEGVRVVERRGDIGELSGERRPAPLI